MHAPPLRFSNCAINAPLSSKSAALRERSASWGTQVSISMPVSFA